MSSLIPKQLKYGSKVESAMAKSYRTNIAPQEGTEAYKPGRTITVNIPTRNNLVLIPPESYLKFKFTGSNGATAGNPARWDSCGAHGLIQRIRVYHGSNLLEDIDNYGQLAKMVFDMQVPTDAAYGKYNILAGTRNDTVLKTNITSDAAVDATIVGQFNALKATLNAGTSALQVNSGESLAPEGGLAANALMISNTYCLNLISILGTLCGANYFPLFACTSSPIRLEIQLVSASINAIGSYSPLLDFELNNVEYIANFMDLSNEAMSVINGSLGGQPLQFASQSYKNYATSKDVAAATTTQVSIPIPAKFSSLKSLFIAIRDRMGEAHFFPFSSVKYGLREYSFRIGPNVTPSKAPSTSTEFFSELIKAMGSMSDLQYHPSIEKDSYTMDQSLAIDLTGSTNSGSFYIGLDLENYPNASKDTMFAGYNSATDDIFANMSFYHGTGKNLRFDTYALFDQVITFQNNTCYVKF